MEDNLKHGVCISFSELIEHGIKNGANIVNGMPWSWKINGKAVTHERDDVYLIETVKGAKRFKQGDMLIAFNDGLHIYPYSVNDTHSPGGCPM